MICSADGCQRGNSSKEGVMAKVTYGDDEEKMTAGQKQYVAWEWPTEGPPEPLKPIPKRWERESRYRRECLYEIHRFMNHDVIVAGYKDRLRGFIEGMKASSVARTATNAKKAGQAAAQAQRRRERKELSAVENTAPVVKTTRQKPVLETKPLLKARRRVRRHGFARKT